MSYTTVRSGFTGPSAKIGGSTEYHQDLKLLEALPIADRVKMIDAIARQNQSIGREIEFSNPAVGGERWDVNADLATKVDLLNRAASAHSHSRHPGWQSFDFYTPFKGKSRFDKGAVEDASIYLPAVAGGKIKRGSGGGYGYYSESVDPAGRVIARVGHGNIDRPEADSGFTVAAADGTSKIPPVDAAALDNEKILADIRSANPLLAEFLERNLAQGGKLTSGFTPEELAALGAPLEEKETKNVGVLENRLKNLEGLLEESLASAGTRKALSEAKLNEAQAAAAMADIMEKTRQGFTQKIQIV